MKGVRGDSLFFVSVNRKCWPTILAEIFGDVVGHTLRTHEDKYFGVFTANLIEVLDEFTALLKVGADFDMLSNVVVSSELHRADVDLNHVVEEVLQ